MNTEPWRPVLRDAVFSDVLELARLDKICFDHHAYSGDLILRFLELDLPCVVAQEQDGDIVGFAMVMPEIEERTGILITLDVAPGSRHRGLGRRMVTWCAMALLGQEPPIELMWLTVAKGNEGAREFYRKLGFKKADIIENYYDDDDAVVMVHLDLNKLAGVKWD
jgi:ribosomal-protein-alanine N-acetyltransferase